MGAAMLDHVSLDLNPHRNEVTFVCVQAWRKLSREKNVGKSLAFKQNENIMHFFLSIRLSRLSY